MAVTAKSDLAVMWDASAALGRNGGNQPLLAVGQEELSAPNSEPQVWVRREVIQSLWQKRQTGQRQLNVTGLQL